MPMYRFLPASAGTGRISTRIHRDGPWRQKSKNRLTDDEVPRHRSPDARVGTLIAIVAHGEILRRAECRRRSVRRTMVGGNVWLRQREAMRMGRIDNSDYAVVNGYRLAGQTDDPLDEIEASVERVFENDDIATLRILEMIAYLIDDEILRVLEGWYH